MGFHQQHDRRWNERAPARDAADASRALDDKAHQGDILVVLPAHRELATSSRDPVCHADR